MEYALKYDQNGNAEAIRQAKLFRAAAQAGRIKNGVRYRFEERSQSFVECEHQPTNRSAANKQVSSVNKPGLRLSERTRWHIQPAKIRRSEPPVHVPTFWQTHRDSEVDRAIARPDNIKEIERERLKLELEEHRRFVADVRRRQERAKKDRWIA
jgi:hypothetical protein